METWSVHLRIRSVKSQSNVMVPVIITQTYILGIYHQTIHLVCSFATTVDQIEMHNVTLLFVQVVGL